MRLGPVPPGVRPVSDRAREGLFSSVALEVPDARVLDLYAGTGAMGIEALSRGAEHAVFVDRAYQASAATPRQPGPNAAARSGPHRGHATREATFVAHAPETDGPFDLVLLDPPYDIVTSELEGVLAALGPNVLSDQGWTVVLTRGFKRFHACHSSTLGRREASSATATPSSSCTGRFHGPDRPLSGDVRPGDERPPRHHRSHQCDLRRRGRGRRGESLQAAGLRRRGTRVHAGGGLFGHAERLRAPVLRVAGRVREGAGCGRPS